MDQFRDGLGDAWATVATFVPKFIAFLLILVVGYFVAKFLGKVVDRILERVGFDRWVERGGIKQALAKSKYDASSILGKLVFYTAMLFVLVLAFGIWGENPVSDLLEGIVAYLPNVFVAILILVVGAAIAAAVKEMVEASIGGLSFGRGLAFGAGTAILIIAIFAALDQLEIAPAIVVGLFYGLLAIVVGSTVIAVGVGGIPVARRYLERAATRTEQESSTIRSEMEGAGDRIKERARARAEQVKPDSEPRRDLPSQPATSRPESHAIEQERRAGEPTTGTRGTEPLDLRETRTTERP